MDGKGIGPHREITGSLAADGTQAHRSQATHGRGHADRLAESLAGRIFIGITLDEFKGVFHLAHDGGPTMGSNQRTGADHVAGLLFGRGPKNERIRPKLGHRGCKASVAHSGLEHDEGVDAFFGESGHGLAQRGVVDDFLRGFKKGKARQLQPISDTLFHEASPFHIEAGAAASKENDAEFGLIQFVVRHNQVGGQKPLKFKKNLPARLFNLISNASLKARN